MSEIAEPAVLVMHKGGKTLRGSERCTIENIAGLQERGVRVILAANNPDVIVGNLAVAPALVIPVEYPEIMFDEGLRLPVHRYLAQLRKLHRAAVSWHPSLVVAGGGLPCQLGLPLARWLRAPIVCQFHHAAARRFLYFWLLPWVDRFITPSRHTHDILLARVRRESTVVPLGTDTEGTFRVLPRDPAWRARLGIAADTMVVAQVGALVPHKGADTLIRAVASLRARGLAAHGLIIGDGPARGGVEQLIAEVAPQAVTLLGRVSEVAPYLQHVADVHVLPSAEEGFGLAVIEAAGCGLPNVVAVPGALGEIVRDGVDGVHIPARNVERLAGALEGLYQDPERRRAMGRAAAARALEEFSVGAYRTRMAEELIATIDAPERRRV
ncbi:MAG TPA: glycosyltransferase family 4 protein [Gemmatimonadales bacterium]|nr:glycosyltransferase family 4 protein [Gemmatimonadales bacterium]